MKHIRTVTQQPQVAVTTLLQAKFELLATAFPSTLQLLFSQFKGGALPLP